jgi:hypothetical protein
MLGGRRETKLIQVKARVRPAERNDAMSKLFFAAAALALAGCAAQPGPGAMALRGIMRDMGRDAAAVSDGLMRENFAAVERSATRLAAHPQPPPEERARILTWLGARAGRFRGYDQEVHGHALAVAAAAKRGDAKGALEAFHKAQSACVACHLEFRDAYMAQFYRL